ncbi:hypothetical protein MCOR27_009242 [Pyricularia oryzae]|uniref:Uncharacterized protein n=1 Tax=Pyricularia grisea TaxID=148305 RepID=A0ABQ8N6R9_PYRGI|nr:hypothetical protein MCOR01_005103 [Pyricularia oryzae]KAI6292182.1 hypothetical protein MCOR33_010045 [Pyricularia grisea]KAH9431864.1 hypothetical protein MCOR02_009134 [Pyricularia oryzae]KAI6256514.1 hypothetical protein MCOR19_007021 [Pyricularia oryzae]KAI6270560.1 hypothetical protein MCOR27_009242 [Pyricularia oryzae]
MIRSRAAVGNFVCLRCQVRRPPYNGPRTAIAEARPVAHRGINRGGQIRYSGTNASSNDAAPANSEANAEAKPHEPPSHDSLRLRRTYRDQREVYWSRGRGRIVPTSQDLSVSILGKPAEALIMQDLGDTQLLKGRDGAKATRSKSNKSKKQVKDKPAGGRTKAQAQSQAREEFLGDGEAFTSPVQTKAWDDMFQGRSQNPTPDEIQAYISELRPTGDALIPQREFDQLIETLITGFTNKQLARYIAENPAKMGLKELPGGKKAAWIVDMKPWKSENTLSRQRGLPTLQTVAGRPMHIKEALVLRLMQDCWGLSVRELVSGMGHLDVHIRNPEFSLLLVGTRRWLQSISRVYLRNVGGRVELRRSDRLMRIFAPKAIAETILDDIDELLNWAVTERIQLDSITSETPSRGALDQLAGLTNSHIEFDEKSREIFVSWIHKNKPPVGEGRKVENTAEKVYRLLLTAYDPAGVSTSTAVFPTVDAGKEPGSLIVDHGVRPTNPPWNFQTSSWARLQRPQSKADLDTPVAESPLKVAPSLLRWPVDSIFREHFHFFKDRHKSFAGEVTHGGRWSKACTATQATFGHLMHGYEEILSAGSRMPVTPEWTSPRMLFPTTPSLLHQDMGQPQPAGPHRTDLIIRFVPSPSDPSTNTHKPPTLELRFLAQKYMIRGIQRATLFAIHGTHQADLLLPSMPVDARINQRQVSMLRGADLHSVPNMGPLREFIVHSTFDLMGNVFRTPSSMKGLLLPEYLMGDGKGEPSEEGSEGAFVKVDYVFADVELHRRIVFDVDGENVTYTSIRNPAQPGINRAEVSVHPSLPSSLPPGVGDSETSEADLNEIEKSIAGLAIEEPEVVSGRFLQSIVKLATNKAMKWSVV